MRRIQVFMDEQLDDRLEAEAAATGVSKAAIIRECVAARYVGRPAVTDPVDALVGVFDGEPLDDPDDIDDIIYAHASE
jgi:Ribbon-helix-helix protein, copG family